MPFSTAAATETRKAGAPTPASTNFINSSKDDHKLNIVRVQRVVAATGISPVFASIAAPFIFGDAA